MRYVNSFRRLSKKPLIGLAVLTFALVAAGGAARHADAATPTYEVELEFYSIDFPTIDDCSFLEISGCGFAETFMTMRGQTQSGGSYDGLPVRNLGKWNSVPSGCSSTGNNWYTKPGNCLASVSPYAGTFTFADTPLCASNAYNTCPYGYYKNSNKIYLTVKAGESIYAAIHAMDYDEVSASDDICNVGHWYGPFTASQLATLNWVPSPMTYSSGDGSCEVFIHLKTIKQLS